MFVVDVVYVIYCLTCGPMLGLKNLFSTIYPYQKLIFRTIYSVCSTEINLKQFKMMTKKLYVEISEELTH